MIKPFTGNYQMTRGFASDIRLTNDAKYGSHKGVDWALPTGTPLYATKDGEITWASNAEDAGNTVTIRSGRFLIKYFHMSLIDVKVGQKVKEGDFIGLSGASGNVTGPHVHFQVESNGVAIDPLPLIEGEREEVVQKVNKGDIDNFCLFLLGRAPTKEDYARVGTSWKETSEAYMMGREFVDRINRLKDRAAAADLLDKVKKEDWKRIEDLTKEVREVKLPLEQLNRIEAKLDQLKENK